MTGRVLTVADSDSCGAGGIQADIKTIMALGGYATTAISVVTAQDTKGIARQQILEPAFVAQQMRTVLADIGADAIKTGMLIDNGIINAVGDVLDECQDKGIPVVIDPAIVSRQGEQMLSEQALATLKRRLFVRATVLTPNLREAELLTGMSIRDMDKMRHAADMLRTLGAEAVLLKAGQTFSNKVVYLVAAENEECLFERPMLETRHTLGAGATLASAVAVNLAQKMDIFAAVESALEFMHEAIIHAPGFGGDAGPMNHAFALAKKVTAKRTSS